MYVVVQDPTLVIRAIHECLSLFLRADIEGLVVDALEAAWTHIQGRTQRTSHHGVRWIEIEDVLSCR